MLFETKQWTDDIDEVSRVIPELDQFAGNSVLITGANGLVCSAIVDILLRYNDTHSKQINIFCAGRSEKRMRERFGSMLDRDDCSFVPYDATRMDNHFSFHSDFIIHGASNANPALYFNAPVETMVSNFSGVKTLLDYAKSNNTKRVLYVSSSEVYGKKNNDLPYNENEYGYIDLLNPRNSYSIGKRAAETLCISFTKEYGTDTVIVRPGHIYGPTASEQDSRVSSMWAYDAAKGRNIIMKSDGKQIRSYCYCLDCASAILKVMLVGESAHAYNISNSNSIISIRELAEIITRVSGVHLEFEIPQEVEKKCFAPMNNSSLNADSLSKLGWRGCFDAERGLTHTINLLRTTMKE